LIKQYESPFAVETTHIKFKDSDLAPASTARLFDVARQYRESIDVYGIEGVGGVAVDRARTAGAAPGETARGEDSQTRQDAPITRNACPKAIQRFTTKGVYDLAKKTHLSFTQGAGHGGSHPHLAHEFVSAVIETATFPQRASIRQLDLRRLVRA
jgi:hypothetical protein